MSQDWRGQQHYLSLGNDLRNNIVSFDPQADEKLLKFVDEVSRSIKRTDIDRLKNIQFLYITGLPRSGTTLLEQAILENTGITQLGESNFWNQVIAKLPFIEKLKWQKYIEEQLLELIDGTPECGRVLLDKMPGNYRYAKLIKKLLPNACVLGVVREEIPLFWSIYNTNFSNDGIRFAYSLRNIILANSSYRSFLDGNSALFTMVQYEDFVRKPSQVIKKVEKPPGSICALIN